MILYPTETVYALGVGVFDNVEITKLFALKNRSADKSVSWLVRSLADITEYAELSHIAEKNIAKLAQTSSASLTLKVLNPQGSLFF